MILRTSRNPAVRRVLVHGLPYFGKQFAELMSGDGWAFTYYPDSGVRNLTAMARDLRSCDLAYQIGGRITFGKFFRAAKLLNKKNMVVHWVGSDTINERKFAAEGKAESWVVDQFHHWAESDWLVDEASKLGISCERMPLPAAKVRNRPLPMPSEFSVLTYVPTVTRGELYGLDRILQVAREMPRVRFDVVGLVDEAIDDPPPNVVSHGRIGDMTDFYRHASLVWRPVRHDGLSHMVLESLGHGRHVLWTYPFPGCLAVSSSAEARVEIERLYALHQQGCLDLNWPGIQAIVENYLPERLKSEILQRLENILDD
ncbi:MAG TPA: hypothetical protein VGD60_14700 [Candidatus Acidoferrales bacterium]